MFSLCPYFSPEEGYLEKVKRVSKVQIFTLSASNQTVANYSLEYRMSYLTDNETVDNLFDLLIGPFTNLLANQTINGWTIDDEFLRNYTDYLKTTESE